MRRKTLLAVLGILSLASVTARANDIEPSKEFYSVPRAANPIVLDGNLSEWTGVPVLADPRFAVPKYSGTNANPNYVLFEQYAGGTWTGPDDHTSAIQIVYDADNVYFGFVVTDNYHENVSGNAWNGDSVQIMIAGPGRTNQVALYNYALGGYEDNSGVLVTNDPAGNSYGGVIIHHEAGAPGQPAPGVTQAVITRNSVTHRTTYEIKMPKEALGLTTLAGGPQFGLGMCINDGDGAFVGGVQYGQAGQEGQKGWGGLGVHSIVFGKTPSETALVTLTKGNDIEPGKEYYTALRTTNTIVLDGNFSEWSGAPVLADPKFAVPKFSGTNANPNYVLFEQYAGGTWTGPDDQTSAVQIVYDADNVYFGFVVTDNYHENVSGNAWNGDSVQLMIAGPKRTNQVALYNYALGGYEDNSGVLVTNDPAGNSYGGVIIHHEAGAPGQPAPGVTQAVVTRDSVNKKTKYEIKLPVAALGLTAPLTVGTQFGLGMAINDGDGAFVGGVQYGEAGQQGQKGWGGLGAHSIVFGKTPSETALVTLGTTVSGNDQLFFSSVNPTIDVFTFRVNDKGSSILNPASVRLVIDGVTNTPTASPKVLDATDFTFTPSRPFLANMDHTYLILARDTLGTTVTSSGTFHTPQYAYLDASDKVLAIEADGPGFMWSIHQNADFTGNSISRALHQLNGLLGPNLADFSATGPTLSYGVPTIPGDYPMAFEVEEVINLEQSAPTPNTQMPGLPGTGASGQTDGVAVEITTFVDMPAGKHTFVVNSDDNFRTVAGHINDLFLGQTAGEFDAPTGRSAADTSFEIRVAEAGTYPFRTFYEEGTDAASIQWKMLKEDGTQVYLNDVANGGFRAWRHNQSPLRTGINMVSPLPGATGISRFTPIFASIREGATTVNLSSVRLRLDGNLLSVTPTRAANNDITVRYQTPTALGGSQHTVTLSYTAGGTSRTQSWNFVLAPVFSIAIHRTGPDIDVTWTEPGVILQESIDLITWNDLTTTGNSYRATPDPRRMVFYRLRK